MPEMDGFTFLRQIRKDEKTSNIPFVFYTAQYIDKKDEDLAFKLGASRFFIKASDPKDLLHELESILEEHKTGIFKTKDTPIESDSEYYREYSERIFTKLGEKVVDLEHLYLQTIKALATMIEVIDPGFTYAHLERVKTLTTKLAERINLPAYQVKAIEIAAYLHDIGKIIIPKELLEKKGPLNDSEWDVIKRHPEIASEILDRVDWPWPVTQIVTAHHERYDGSGYPHGIKGSAIPIGARIFAIVDSWDAMTNDRPYRKAMSKEEAFSELRRCRGTKFEPFIVDEFINLINDLDEESDPIERKSA